MKLYVPILIFLFQLCIGLEIPIHRQRSPRHFMFYKDITDEHFYGGNRTNDTVAFYKYMDMEYYTILNIGSPGQQFKVALDSTAGDSWVYSNLCSFTMPACWIHNKYDNTHSSTYKANTTDFEITVPGGMLKGYISVDKVNIGHLNVKDQAFVEVLEVPWMYLFSKMEGSFGLGFEALSTLGANGIFHNIYLQKLVANPIIGLYISRDLTTSHAGVMYLGDFDQKHINSTIVYLPVTQPPRFWQFKTDSISLTVNKEIYQFCNGGCQAAIDTTNPLIVGPMTAIRAINILIGATTLVKGRYEIPCDKIPKLPKIDFVIGNQTFTLHGKDLAQELSFRGVSLCLSIFVPTKHEGEDANTWFLGGAFLERAFVVFDLGNERIGFADVR